MIKRFIIEWILFHSPYTDAVKADLIACRIMRYGFALLAIVVVGIINAVFIHEGFLL